MQISVRSNVLGELRNIRKGVTIQEPGTVIDELFQNAKRARATQVYVWLQGDWLVFEDDGVGCPDPQVVFEKALSGWGLQEAFGEGFFSVFYLADVIEVASYDWKVRVDVRAAIEEGQLTFPVEHGLPHRRGFRVQLWGERIAKHFEALWRHLHRVGPHQPFSVWVNGAPLPHKPVSEAVDLDDSVKPYVMRVTTDLYTGWIAPAASYPGGIELWYECRFVKRHGSYYGITGVLELAPDSVTLKAPDRREIVEDEKKQRFEQLLRQDVRALLLSIVEYPELAHRLDWTIALVLSVEDYLAHLKAPERAGKSCQPKLPLPWQPPSPEEVGRRAPRQSIEGPLAEDRVPQAGADPTECGESLVEFVQKSKDRLVWASYSDIDSHPELIREAEYFGFTVVIAKNELYRMALGYLGVPNVRDLLSANRHCEAANVGARTAVEHRLLRILDALVAPRAFQIADLSCEVHYKGRSFPVPVAGWYDACARCILLDRKTLALTPYTGDVHAKGFTKSDSLLLMRQLPIIAHELAHLQYGTRDNTLLHFQLSEELCRALAMRASTPEFARAFEEAAEHGQAAA